MTRRNIILLIGLSATSALLGYSSLFHRFIAKFNVTIAKGEDLQSKLNLLRQISNHCRPDMTVISDEAILSLLKKMKSIDDLSELYFRLNESITNDFIENRTVNVEGWMLSVTECQFAKTVVHLEASRVNLTDRSQHF